MSLGTAKSARNEYSFRPGPATAVEAVATRVANNAAVTAAAVLRTGSFMGTFAIGEEEEL
jgi:hypothetical protein